MKNTDFKYLFKSSNLVSKEEGEVIHDLASTMYPDFRKYFEVNRFYSSVKPQLILLVYDGKRLVAEGKLLWRKLQIKQGKNIKLFVFGFTVDSDYQRLGIGTHMMEMCVAKTKELKGGLLYGCTDNPQVMKMMERFNFKRLTTKLTYTEALTKRKTEEVDPAYGLEFVFGLVDQINKLPELYLGVGPL